MRLSLYLFNDLGLCAIEISTILVAHQLAPGKMCFDIGIMWVFVKPYIDLLYGIYSKRTVVSLLTILRYRRLVIVNSEETKQMYSKTLSV